MFVFKSAFILALCAAASSHSVPSKDLQVPQYVLSPNLHVPKIEDPPAFDSYLPMANNEEGEELTPPKDEQWNPDDDPNLYFDKNAATIPTNAYPKKYNKELYDKLKPLISKSKDEESPEVLAKQRDLTLTLTPPSEGPWNPNNDPIYYYNEKPQNLEDKKNYNYEKVQNQRLVKEVKEPEASASYIPSSSSSSSNIALQSEPPKGQRVEFQMHGYDGPKSYKWGYDTGKGHNRQFRFEERNKDGYVKGHYGYIDTHGKLQLVHYNSHPTDGFRSY